MADKKSKKDPFEATEAGFSKAMEGWGELASRTIAAQGAPDVLPVVQRLKQFAVKLVKSLFERLRQVLGQLDPFGAAGAVGTMISAGIEDLLKSINELIDDLLAAGGAATDTAVAAILGLVEAIKKLFHLILDGLKLPLITQPVEIFLDLIDNVLGNIAELISPKAGKMARQFRNDMYGQLYAIRRADAARSGRFAPAEEFGGEE